MTGVEYAQIFFDTMESLATLITGASTANGQASKVMTRYITSKAGNEEEWAGYLRDESGKTDIWLMTVFNVKGLRQEDKAVGDIKKPITLALEYFFDYRQGLNYADMGSKTNSERIFLTNFFSVDYVLEQKQYCLQPNVIIKDWDFTLRLKHFTSDTAHYAQGKVTLDFSNIIV